MAKEEGIPWFPLLVDFFNDRKTRVLRAKYGPDGIVVYLYILCEIYRDKGYYLPVDQDLQYLIADELGMSHEKIGQIMSFLLDRSLLIKVDTLSILSFPDTVITGRRIQKNYQRVKKGLRRTVDVIDEIWLLEDDETDSFINRVKKSENTVNSVKNTAETSKNTVLHDTRKGKVSKGKISKRERPQRAMKHQYGEYKHVLLTDQEAEKLKSDYPGQFEAIIRRLDEYKEQTGKAYKNDNLAIRKWVVNAVKEDLCKKPPETEEDRSREEAVNEFEQTANDWFYQQD